VNSPLSPPDHPSSFSRRIFLGLSVLLGGGSACLLARGLIAFIGGPGSPDPPARFVAATGQELKGLKKPWKYQRGVWLLKDENGWYTLNNRCTHLGCQPALDPQAGELRCPCHGSRFNLQGQVLQGPAAKPLSRWLLVKGPREEIWVDTRSEVDPAFRLRL
jgi:Rieske Fe-S protein